jgi:signal transduction histidine kinase
MTDDDSAATQQDQGNAQPQHNGMAQVAGGFAHNFNNLLTVISGNLQLVDMRLHDDALKSLLREAALACEMGARMTESLLTYAKQRRLVPVMTAINATLHPMDGIIRHAAGTSIAVVMTLDPEASHIMIDRSEFESAVLNLVLNARDAMPDGGELEIATRQITLPDDDIGPDHLTPGRYVHVSVRDTGTGMTPAVLRRAFEPFFSTKDNDRGTGLGLATVQGFAEQSGGAAVLQSVLGRGTAVHLYFPAHEVSGGGVTPA